MSAAQFVVAGAVVVIQSRQINLQFLPADAVMFANEFLIETKAIGRHSIRFSAGSRLCIDVKATVVLGTGVDCASHTGAEPALFSLDRGRKLFAELNWDEVSLGFDSSRASSISTSGVVTATSWAGK